MDQRLALHQLPLEIRDKAMIAEYLFLDYGKILASLRYQAKPICHYVDSVMGHPHTKQTFSCHSREIVFILNYYDADYDVSDRLITLLHRLPYTESNDLIDLEKLLQKRNIAYDPLMFFAGNYSGNIDEQFKALFDHVMRFLQENIYEILDGDDWEIGCYSTW